MTRNRLDDNEASIGRTIGPNTMITVNLKTLVIALGIVLSGLTTIWVNLSAQIEKSNESTSKQIENVAIDVKEIKDQDLRELNRRVGEVSGNFEGFVKAQNAANNTTTSNQNTPVSNLTPSLPH